MEKSKVEYRLIYCEAMEKGIRHGDTLLNALDNGFWIIKMSQSGNGVMYLLRRRYDVDHCDGCGCPGCAAEQENTDTRDLTF